MKRIDLINETKYLINLLLNKIEKYEDEEIYNLKCEIISNLGDLLEMEGGTRKQ